MIAKRSVKQAGIENQRVVGLEPGGLPGDQSIGNGMGFIEAVAAELQHQGEELFRLLSAVAVLHASVHECILHVQEFLFLLLGHRLAHRIRFRQGEPGRDLGGAHGLFLIDHDPVGIFQHRFQFFARVDDLIGMGLVFKIQGNTVDTGRPVQGKGRNDIGKPIRNDLPQKALHAFRFKLEDAAGIRPLKQGQGPPVLKGDLHDVKARILFLDHPDHGIDHREVAQAEEIHLDETPLLKVILRVLGGQRILRFLRKRQDFNQRTAAHDDAGGVDRAVSRQAFHLCGGSEESLVFFLGGHDLAQAVILYQRILQRDAGGIWNHPAEHVDFMRGNPHRLAEIPQHRLGAEGIEGNDIGGMVHPVFLPHIADHLLPAVVGDIRINIRHRLAGGIEKTFKEKIVLHRIHHRDPEAIGNK